MSSISQAGCSFTGYAFKNAANLINKLDGNVAAKRCVGVGLYLPLCVVSIVAASVEAIIRGVLALIAKGVTFLVPKQLAKQCDRTVYFLTSSAVRNIQDVAGYALATVLPLLSEKTCKQAGAKIIDAFSGVESGIEKFSRVHINGSQEQYSQFLKI